MVELGKTKKFQTHQNLLMHLLDKADKSCKDFYRILTRPVMPNKP